MTAADQITVGDSLPLREIAADAVDLFAFSAATSNPHRIHFDRTWAQDVEGLDDLVLHGPLHAARLAVLIQDWAGELAHLVRFAASQRGTAYVGQTVTYSGSVRGIDDHPAHIDVFVDLAARIGDRVIVDGDALVRIPVTRAEGPSAAR